MSNAWTTLTKSENTDLMVTLGQTQRDLECFMISLKKKSVPAYPSFSHLFYLVLNKDRSDNKPFQGLAIPLKVNLMVPEILIVSGSPGKAQGRYENPVPGALSPPTPSGC